MTHGVLGWLIVAMLAAGESKPPVRPGLEVLLTDSVHLVTGRRVGLVTNQGGIDRKGTHAVELLRTAGIDLVALFSPEHGFRGAADPGEAVASTVDSATGLPIYSLYGRTSRPTDEMLRGVEVLLIDLPDVGSRYFTFLATTIEVMRAAVGHRIPVIVLDRPDPIGGRIQGTVLDTAFRSFIGSLAVPMRYGMTLGELARLARSDLGIPVDLTVVPASGWRRGDDMLTTGLPFRSPSPNLADVESLFHYPGTCLFEGTALSVGRGTDHAFHQIGAPWLDTARVLALVRKARPAGVRFESVTFTPIRPGDGKFPGVRLPGIRLVITDRARYDPIRTALDLLAAVRLVHGRQIGWINAHFDRLAGGSGLRQALEAGVPTARIMAGWKAALRQFERRRKPALLYR